MGKIFELLDPLEEVERQHLVAEIEVCKRRIAWCEVLIQMMDKQGVTVAATKEKEKRPEKNLEFYNGKKTLWVEARDHIKEHGLGKWPTAYLAQCLIVDPSRLNKALSKHPHIFIRESGHWMLVQEDTDNAIPTQETA